MQPPPIENAEMIYQAEIQFTQIWDFGVPMESFRPEKGTIPPQGARFDFEFEGRLTGPKLQGTILGTDHLTVRADGQFLLHLHARIQTDDGAPIALTGEGITTPIEGTEKTKMGTSISLFTGAPAYVWLNHIQVWSIGILDVPKGELAVKAYAL